MSERRYAYQRIAPGLILLPGNDGTTLYAIGRYVDGPTYGLEDEPHDFTAWGWGRVDRLKLEARVRLGDDDGYVQLIRDHVYDNVWPRHWRMRDAIDAALASEARRSGEDPDVKKR